jgi:uncharacterized protein YjdB
MRRFADGGHDHDSCRLWCCPERDEPRGSGQGSVSLTAAASTGGASISLSSSNPSVATVQTPVTIQAGALSATFTVTALTAGMATITASLNGSTRQSPTLTVTAGTVALSRSR